MNVLNNNSLEVIGAQNLALWWRGQSVGHIAGVSLEVVSRLISRDKF